MRLDLQMEQFIVSQGKTTVRALSRRFGVSEGRCREALAVMVPYGIEISDDGWIFARCDD